MNPFDWRRLPPLPALRAFEAAARLGSFSAAARVLNVTPPAVAQQVRGLERELGLRLVAGAGRSLHLTDEGTRLADALNGGFAAIAGSLEALQQADRSRGLRVTLTHGFAHEVVVPALPEFWAAHPDIPLTLVPDSRVTDLRRDAFDLAVRSGDGQWTDGEVAPLHLTRVVLAGSPALAEAAVRDIHAVPWILSPADERELSWLDAHGVDHSWLKITEIALPTLACTAAAHGLGLLFATETILRDHIAAGRLRIVPGWTLPETAYWTVTPHGPPRAATQTFVGWLRRRLRAG
jgi:LysR family transcriptional regulator, glycine cleavage system transcriptional activator